MILLKTTIKRLPGIALLKQQFIDNLDQVVIEEFNTEFARIHHYNSYDIAYINDITRKVSDILINAADNCQ